MDFYRRYCFSFPLLIILLVLCLHARGEGIGSVFFLDSPSHQYFRSPPPGSIHEMNSMSLPEVGAAMSVLLGSAPSTSLSAGSSSKLNEVLMPNPFDRPRAVFLLEVSGAEGSQHAVVSHNDLFNSALRRRVSFDKNVIDILLPGHDSYAVSLNDPLILNTKFSDSELNDLASWLGGSYVANTLEPLGGELTFPLKNGVELKLQMSKKADRDFIASIASLIRDFESAMKVHQNSDPLMLSPAELMHGSFNGIKALQEQYGTETVAQQGLELFDTLIYKILSSLDSAYKGQIVGVILFSGSPSSESQTKINVNFTSWASHRLLEEKEGSVKPSAIAEVMLVRQTLAWLTGIILLIATLLGIYFLLNMPITRDTLLYSNVKLD